MCIKHWNLQCFLSMSLNVFNPALGKWYIPSLSGGPGGGGLPYIYILWSYEYSPTWTTKLWTKHIRLSHLKTSKKAKTIHLTLTSLEHLTHHLFTLLLFLTTDFCCSNHRRPSESIIGPNSTVTTGCIIAPRILAWCQWLFLVPIKGGR